MKKMFLAAMAAVVAMTVLGASRPMPEYLQSAVVYQIVLHNFMQTGTFKDFPDPKLYNPAKLDTDQWMEAAKAYGAKYVVLVAKHGSGFLQWQSDLYPYGLGVDNPGRVRAKGCWLGGEYDATSRN